MALTKTHGPAKVSKIGEAYELTSLLTIYDDAVEVFSKEVSELWDGVESPANARLRLAVMVQEVINEFVDIYNKENNPICLDMGTWLGTNTTIST